VRRALVLGGTGFLGLNLVDALLDDGWRVRVALRRHAITLHLRSREVERVPVDTGDVRALARVMRGEDAVFMVAGHYPRYSLDLVGECATGVLQARVVADAALRARVPRLIYTSSTGALARAEGRPAREDDIPTRRPRSVYRAVKWAMEREVERYRGRGLRTVTMIPSGCVGPWDARVGTGRLLVGPLRGELPFRVAGTIALVDVEDAMAAHVAAAAHADPAARYCLGGHAVTVSALLEHICARWGATLPVEIPLTSARALADQAERWAAPRRERVAVPRELVDLVEHGQAVSSAAAQRDLGFALRPLEGSLDRAHAWFESRGYLRPPGGRRTCSRVPKRAARAPSS